MMDGSFLPEKEKGAPSCPKALPLVPALAYKAGIGGRDRECGHAVGGSAGERLNGSAGTGKPGYPQPS
jgi:hypothetical protein